MSEIPGDLKFQRSHEWARLEEGGRVTVGISFHAQDQLGDVVYVELPTVGDHVEQGAGCAVVMLPFQRQAASHNQPETVVPLNLRQRQRQGHRPQTFQRPAHRQGL